MGTYNIVFTSLFVVLACLTLVSFASPPDRELLEDNDVSSAIKSAREGLSSFTDTLWGGTCSTDAQCADYLATCVKEADGRL